MATRYLSKHHSDDDPGGLIQDALAAGPDFAGPAEDLLLAWTLRLDRAIDPRAAAARLLAAQGLDDAPTPPGEAGRLVALLRETAAAPQVQPRRRRRSRDGSTGKPPR